MSLEPVSTPYEHRGPSPRNRLTPVPGAIPEHDVLLLDDEPAVQSVLAQTLERRGFKVFASTHWAEVARRVFESRGHRVFLVADLNMPGIRGEDFCRIVKSYNTNIVLILFTGAERVRVEEAAARLGGVRFVLKREGASRLGELVEELRTDHGGAP